MPETAGTHVLFLSALRWRGPPRTGPFPIHTKWINNSIMVKTIETYAHACSVAS